MAEHGRGSDVSATFANLFLDLPALQEDCEYITGLSCGGRQVARFWPMIQLPKSFCGCNSCGLSQI
jgi:hypothetical protein